MISCKIASFIGMAVRLRGGAMLRRFVRRQEGAAAVEFALVAAPFLALMFAIIETALVFFAGQSLETAAADSARLIMTGQAQTQGYSETKFKQEVCARVAGLFDCAGELYVDVKSYPKFADASANISKPIDDQERLERQQQYLRDGLGRSLRATYFGALDRDDYDEPFALLHRRF